jgi:hypothetical protein
MARNAELKAHITAQDDASKVIDKVAGEADRLDKKKVDVTVGGDTSGATSAFGRLKEAVAGAEGGFGKLKAGGAAAFDAVKGAAGGLALGAAGALTTFAVKAVGDFQAVALGAGKMSDALGISTQDASRLQETAGDLGIGVDALESSLGKMNKTLGTSPAKFAAIGAEIAKNKDGTTDVVRTFENVATALDKIQDPAKRAAAASAIFGKGWASMAELIQQGGDGIAKTLASVESAKVIDPGQVAQARKFRDELDQLRGVAESVSLEVGSRVASAVADLVDMLIKGESEVRKFADSVSQYIPDAVKDAAKPPPESSGGPWVPSWLTSLPEAIKGGLSNVGKAAGDMKTIVASAWDQAGDIIHGRNEGVSASLADLGTATGDVNKRFTDMVWGSKKLADAAKATADAQYEQRTSFVKTADALKDWADAQADALEGTEAFNTAVGSMDWGGATLKGAVAGMSAFHEQFFGLADIAAANEAAFDGLGESLKKNGKSFDLNTEKGRANQKAVEDLSSTLDGQLAAAYADSGGDMDTFKGKAAGIADTLRGRLQNELGLSAGAADDMIRRLGLLPEDVETRYQLSGTEEARLKIGLLQGSIDHLPENVRTQVTQQIIVGDYQGALATIQGYYNRNPATVKVNTVVGTIQAAGARMFPGYTPAPSMVPAGVGVTSFGAPVPAAAATSSAGSFPVMTIPVRLELPSAAELARRIGRLHLSAQASLRAENRITGARP